MQGLILLLTQPLAAYGKGHGNTAETSGEPAARSKSAGAEGEPNSH